MHSALAPFMQRLPKLVGKLFSLNNQGQGQAFYSAIGFGARGAVGALLSGYIWDFDPKMVWLFAFSASSLAFLLSLSRVDSMKGQVESLMTKRF